MNQCKLNLYKELKLDNYYWGGALKISEVSIDLSSKYSIVNFLDQVCITEKLNGLGESWNEINYNNFKLLLNSALQFDLGFSEHRVMSVEKAEDYFGILTNDFNINTSRYFTNCFDHFWNNENKVFTANSISKNTLDLAVSIVSNDKLLFVYFLFED